jgi:hypothetical protein
VPVDRLSFTQDQAKLGSDGEGRTRCVRLKPGAITPELPAQTIQTLVVTQAQIRQEKVAPGAFVKQPGAITFELPAPTTQILVVA